MDTRLYPITVSVLLKPIINTRIPGCRVGLNGQRQDVILDKESWFDFEYTGSKDSLVTLEVEHYGKTDRDTDIVAGKDIAIIVEAVKLNGITSPKFIWEGIYRPIYPRHLVNQPAELKHSNYLGWNGSWSLDITLPVFTWIHNLENLGWIYD